MRLLRLHMAFSAPCIFKLTTFILLFYLIDIVQVPSSRNKNVLEEKVWPCYRGKRAGKQSKGRALYKRHIITTLIRTRPLSRKAKPAASSSGHTRLTEGLFVSTPSRNLALLIRLCRLLCSRMWVCLSPKIDEVRVAICNANLDFICITETKNHIANNFVLVSGYNIICRDRVTSNHGGICMYVRDSIRYDVLSDLMDENFEVPWVKIRPKATP